MAAFLKKWKKYLTFAALLSCFVNILQLTFSFYMFTIYRNVIISYSGYSLFNITVAAFFALTVFGFLTYFRFRLLTTAGRDLNLSLRRPVLIQTLKGYALLQQKSYHQGLADLETLKQFFSSSAINALFDAPWAPFFLLVIYSFHPMIGLIATSGALFMIGLSILQELLIRDSMKTANTIYQENQRIVDGFLRNAEVINGMGMTSAIGGRFDQSNAAVIRNQTASSLIAGAVQSVTKPLQNVIQVLIYCFGAYYAIKEGFDVGLMVAASIIMGRGLAPLMQVTSSWKFIIQTRDAYRRLDVFVGNMEQQPEQMPLPSPKGELTVENAFFRLGGPWLLNNISFGVSAGEFLGVIGPSGAGKTTLCKLLLGIWPPAAGRVALDRRSVFSWDMEKFGQNIGYLPQEIELFSASVAENIARMGEVDMEQVEKAARICGIHEMILKLPSGYQTLLEGRDGLQLSGGQKQKLGLARALYADPTLLVLDEPTSNLDDQGEKDILEALLKIKQAQTCTLVMVTHKPELLQSMDKVLVLQNGQVALFGPRDAVFGKLAGLKTQGQGAQ
jgi:PrtD family type I secretion system ABC transporter